MPSSRGRHSDAPSLTLAVSEARFRAVWDAAGDAMALSDPAGVVLDVNPAYCALYGLAPGDVVGRSFTVIFPEEHRTWAEEEYRRVFADRSIPPMVESVIQRADGSERLVEVRYTFLSEGEQRTAMLSVVRDVTERRHGEIERARLYQAERAALAAAEAALALRDQVLAGVSHDLRTPLTTVIGSTQMLRRLAARRPGDHQWLIDGLDMIESSAATMSTMIADLLDAARLEIGRPLEPRLAPTDLIALARRVAGAHQVNSPRHAIQVETTLPELTGVWDPARLERVLDNLLSNAIKYSPAGGTVTVEVTSSSETDGTWAILTVRDQGIGIPATDLPRVFERFYRAEDVTGGIDGAGIGLASAKQIVDQHGGTIAVISDEGRGSTFRMRLPLKLGDR